MNTATINPELCHRLSHKGRDLGRFTTEELWQLRVAIDTALAGVQIYEEWRLILAAVCRVSGFSWEEMTSKSRISKLAYARQIAMALIYERTSMSLNQVGEKFGGRDHGTVRWAIQAVQWRRGTRDGRLIRLVESALGAEKSAAKTNGEDCVGTVTLPEVGRSAESSSASTPPIAAPASDDSTRTNV